jgi:gluconolactonase
VYSTGPSGLWVFSPKGVLLGRIRTPEIPANIAWGDPDWKGLYMTARTGLYRMRVNIPGVPVGLP